MIIMEFTLTFILNDNTSVSSKDVIQTPGIYRQSFVELYNLSCTIQVRHSSVVWEIEDELPALVAHFFLGSVNTVSVESAAHYEFFEYPGKVQLVLLDNKLSIGGDFVEDLVIEFKVFKELAIELGKHTIEFLELLNNSKFQPDLDLVREALDFNTLT